MPQNFNIYIAASDFSLRLYSNLAFIDFCLNLVSKAFSILPIRVCRPNAHKTAIAAQTN